MHLVYPPNFYRTILSNFSWAGITVVPREIEDTGYAKFWAVNKVHYGLCANGKWEITQNVTKYFKLNERGECLPPMLGLVGNTVRLSQLPLVIATSSIAISPVYDDPAIPSKITYK